MTRVDFELPVDGLWDMRISDSTMLVIDDHYHLDKFGPTLVTLLMCIRKDSQKLSGACNIFTSSTEIKILFCFALYTPFMYQ